MDFDIVKAKRRNIFFKTRMCNRFPNCSWGSKCGFAHSEAELQPHPDLRLTKPCPAFLRAGTCSAGAECTFAHVRQGEPRNRAQGTEGRSDENPLNVHAVADTALKPHVEPDVTEGRPLAVYEKNTFLVLEPTAEAPRHPRASRSAPPSPRWDLLQALGSVLLRDFVRSWEWRVLPPQSAAAWAGPGPDMEQNFAKSCSSSDVCFSKVKIFSGHSLEGGSPDDTRNSSCEPLGNPYCQANNVESSSMSGIAKDATPSDGCRSEARYLGGHRSESGSPDGAGRPDGTAAVPRRRRRQGPQSAARRRPRRASRRASLRCGAARRAAEGLRGGVARERLDDMRELPSLGIDRAVALQKARAGTAGP